MPSAAESNGYSKIPFEDAWRLIVKVGVTVHRYGSTTTRLESFLAGRPVEEPGLSRRMQVGMDADIVVFDPRTISDVGTYQKPNQPAVGVQTVLVNGQPVVRQGNPLLDADAGRPIRLPVANQ
jgi:N-acyl-D-glutamate deacylase